MAYAARSDFKMRSLMKPGCVSFLAWSINFHLTVSDPEKRWSSSYTVAHRADGARYGGPLSNDEKHLIDSDEVTDEDFKEFLWEITKGDVELEKGLLKAINSEYEDYCAHPPDFQWNMMPSPLHKKELEADNLELVGVQLVFRHGARDLASNQQCFKPMNESFGGCHLASLVLFERLSGTDANPMMHEHPLPLVKQVINAYPNSSRHVWTPHVTCGRGELLDEALPMTEAFARALQSKYFHRLPKYPKWEDMRFYASDEQRTLGTLYYILHMLLPLGLPHGTRLFPLFTRPPDTDPWECNVPCRRAMTFRREMDYHTAAVVKKAFPGFAARWKAMAGTDFLATFKDCLNVGKCTHQKDLKLPSGIQPHEHLFKEAQKVSLAVFHKNYLKDMRSQQLLMAPVLLELENYLLEQVAGTGPMVNFWSSHDETMISVLAALGIWDGVWPPYTDSMVLEVYRSKDKKQAYFRWLRSAKPLPMPWCTGSKAGPSGLCKVEFFLPEEIKELRDQDVYNRECSLLSEQEEPFSAFSFTAIIFMALSLCITSCMCGYLMRDALHWCRSNRNPEQNDLGQSLLRVSAV